MRRDDGFTLTEAIVSLVIFGLLASITASLLIGLLSTTKANDQRAVASSLASQQIEAVRGQDALAIADGLTSARSTVNGTTYDIRQTANFVSSGEATSLCAGTGSSLAYKLITVEVRWPDMGSTQPIRMDTLRALGLGSDALDPEKGTLAILVKTPKGRPIGDAVVSLSPGALTRVTGSDGCAVFTGVTPGSYFPTVSKAGHISREGLPTFTPQAAVTALKNTVTRATIDSYAASGRLAVTLTSPNGFPIPATLGLTLENSLWASPRARPFADCSAVQTAPRGCVSWDTTVPAAPPRVAAAVFPDPYRAWAGTCSAVAPASPATSSLTQVGESTTSPAEVRLVDLQVQLNGVSGTSKVWAVQPANAQCTSGEQWPLTETAAGVYRAALPAGTWTIVRTDGAAPTGTTGVATAVLSPGQTQPVQVIG
nr:prepilin-type N-terminal cleavage/methylation domain-containing protein [Motilibacter aurantiacus]